MSVDAKEMSFRRFLWRYAHINAVRLTFLDPHCFPTTVMPKHCSECADAENCFDEHKNQ